MRSEPDLATGLDLLLTGSTGSNLRPLLPGASRRMAAALAARPMTVARRGAGLVTELTRIGLGRSRVAPHPGDARYTDPAWTANPLLRRLVQAHIAAGDAAAELVEDAGLDPADRERIHLAVDVLRGALAPSNTPLNPIAWRAAIDTGGASLVRGARRLLDDLAGSPRVPWAAAGAVEVGTDVAATPGAVVLRTPVLELIQYLPQTETVRETPLLVVPPLINKYYLADLAPGRSLVEHHVRGGQQVFAISWRNPDEEQAGWDLDAYGQAVLDAMDACERITRTGSTALVGFCAGGVLAAAVAAHLAAIGAQQRVASMTFVATLLDQGHPPDPDGALVAVEASAEQGYLDGATLAETLAWLRPDDLVWPYWVHGYLGGEPLPASEVLFWNADTTRMTAGLHRDLVDIAVNNALVTPDAVAVLGTPVDLSKIDADSYTVAGIADDLCPWQACYPTGRLPGGEGRFVLASGGHLASVVDPDGPGARFRTGPVSATAPERWLDAATLTQGSWWPDHLSWLAERSGAEIDAPAELGGRHLHAVAPAPGEYVLTR